MMFIGTTDVRGSVQQSVNNSGVIASRLSEWLKIRRYVSTVALVVAMIATPSESFAQGRKKTKPPRKSEPSLAEKLSKANAEVVATTNDYKAKLVIVLELQEKDVRTLAEMLEKRKALLAESIISKKEDRKSVV